jgi:hypothetical protein
LEEICRPPFGVEISTRQLEYILKYWRLEFHHPLAEPLGKVAKLMIQGENISTHEAINLLNLIADYPYLYSALSIPYFACNDVDGSVDKVYHQIVQGWKSVE